MAVRPIPEGFRTVTPFLVVADGDALMHFLRRAFDAQEVECHRRSDGRIAHAQMRVGDSRVMLADTAPKQIPTTAAFYLYLPDTDAAYRSALRAGATSLLEPADQFYGDRNAGVIDSNGITWWIATHVEDVPAPELAQRAKATAR